VLLVAVHFEWLLTFLVDDGEKGKWSLFWGLEFQEWMWMWDGGLTLRAEIEVWDDGALVADTNDW